MLSNIDGMIKVPIFDLTDAIRSDSPPPCNQETLTGSIEWAEGEIPANSYVCIHYIPSWYDHEKHKEIQFNILRIVILSTPRIDWTVYVWYVILICTSIKSDQSPEYWLSTQPKLHERFRT